jgi:hypothetical protein
MMIEGMIFEEEILGIMIENRIVEEIIGILEGMIIRIKEEAREENTKARNEFTKEMLIKIEVIDNMAEIDIIIDLSEESINKMIEITMIIEEIKMIEKVMDKILEETFRILEGIIKIIKASK